MQRTLKIIIRLYRYLISPLFAPSCRFYPSCSAYALEAVESRGVLRGTLLTIKRILKCHPFNVGGYDPVPETDKKKFQEVVGS